MDWYSVMLELVMSWLCIDCVILIAEIAAHSKLISNSGEFFGGNKGCPE